MTRFLARLVHSDPPWDLALAWIAAGVIIGKIHAVKEITRSRTILEEETRQIFRSIDTKGVRVILILSVVMAIARRVFRP